MTANSVGSSRGNRLYTSQPQYYFDQKQGIYKLKNFGGAYSMADEQTNEVKDISPTGKPVFPQAVVVILTILAAVAGVLVVVPGMPPVVVSISTALVAICAALGIASPGIRQK